MPKRRPRKPRDLSRPFNCQTRPSFKSEHYPGYIWIGLERLAVKDAKRLHAWLTRAIEYLEARDAD